MLPPPLPRRPSGPGTCRGGPQGAQLINLKVGKLDTDHITQRDVPFMQSWVQKLFLKYCIFLDFLTIFRWRKNSPSNRANMQIPLYLSKLSRLTLNLLS